MELSKKLKHLRKQKGLSQLELAEKLQVSRQAVSGWEAGSSRPSTENLKSLGALYDVPLEYLLNDDALELMRVNLNDGQEKVQGIKAERKSVVWVLIVIGIIAVAVFAIFFQNGYEQTTQMTEIEGSDMDVQGIIELPKAA